MGRGLVVVGDGDVLPSCGVVARRSRGRLHLRLLRDEHTAPRRFRLRIQNGGDRARQHLRRGHGTGRARRKGHRARVGLSSGASSHRRAHPVLRNGAVGDDPGRAVGSPDQRAGRHALRRSNAASFFDGIPLSRPDEPGCDDDGIISLRFHRGRCHPAAPAQDRGVVGLHVRGNAGSWVERNPPDASPEPSQGHSAPLTAKRFIAAGSVVDVRRVS